MSSPFHLRFSLFFPIFPQAFYVPMFHNTLNPSPMTDCLKPKETRPFCANRGKEKKKIVPDTNSQHLVASTPVLSKAMKPASSRDSDFSFGPSPKHETSRGFIPSTPSQRTLATRSMSDWGFFLSWGAVGVIPCFHGNPARGQGGESKIRVVIYIFFKPLWGLLPMRGTCRNLG